MLSTAVEDIGMQFTVSDTNKIRWRPDDEGRQRRKVDNHGVLESGIQ